MKYSPKGELRTVSMLLLPSIHAEILNLKLHCLSTSQSDIKDKKPDLEM